MSKENQTDPSDREVISTRIFNTTKERLFAAWTDPEQLSKWWGPTGFTNTFHEFNLEPGGDWRFTMHGPDRKNYENYCIFISIKIKEEIILDHISLPKFRVVASFIEEGNGTRLIFRQIFDIKGEFDKLRAFVTNANEQNFDRLETLIAEIYK